MNTRKVTIYLPVEKYDDFKRIKERTNLSVSDQIVAIILNEDKRKVINEANELIKPSEDKLNQLLDNQRYIIDAVYSNYRTSNYTARLLNNGLPLLNINGTSVFKPDSSIKNVARKKTMDDYSRLRSLSLAREDFLAEQKEEEQQHPVKSEPKHNNTGIVFN